MNETTGIIGGSVMGMALFVFGAAGGWYARGEVPPVEILDEELQPQVVHYRQENEELRQEVERLENDCQ